MASTKKYFHDHFVLLLLSINSFLAAFAVIFISLRLGTSHGTDYIVQYRPNLGLDSYKAGSIIQIISFILFAILVLVINLGLSYKVYKIHRQLSIAVLALGILLLVLTIIISNALLLLR
ncbi:MAG TPA: hypothetical protein VFN31_01760 [Candidatus Saccharimonadales bacterium]|nr:hypothetical protein [Candidatus Saccharimonadales bacterium]